MLNNKVLIITVLAIVVFGFLLYPLLSILKKSDETEISQEDANKLVEINKKILGVTASSDNDNSTNTQNLQEIIHELNQKITQLVDLYNVALQEHNVTATKVATLIKELEEKLSLLEEKGKEYVQNRSDWENTYENNTARIEALKIRIKDAEILYNSSVVQTTNLTEVQEGLNETLSELDNFIQSVIVSFYSSLMDIADLSRINETLFRMYHIESLTDFALSSDGGFVLVGSIYAENSIGKLNGIILRVDSNGKEIWRYVLIMDGSVKIWSVAIGENEQIAIAGYLPTDYVISRSFSGTLFIGSLDKEGYYLWSFTQGNTFDGAHMVISSSDGNFLAVGQLIKLENYGLLMTVRKFTPAGDKIWQYYTQSYAEGDWILNYYADDYSCYDASSIIETRDGNYLIGGYLSDYQWLLKLSIDGTFIWERKGGFFWYYIQEIKEMENGCFLTVLNRYNGYWFGYSSQIIMYSPLGEKQWNIQTSTTSFSSTIYSSIDLLPDGFIVGGEQCNYDQYSNRRCYNYLVKYNFERSLVWEKTYSSGTITRIKYRNDSIMATTSSSGMSSFFKFYPS